MSETEFISRADAILQLIAQAIDDSDIDCDWELSNGILNITFDTELGTAQAVINRHIPSREIWLAAMRSGAAHFSFDGKFWRNTRAQETLGDAIRRLFAKEAQEIIKLPATV